MLPECISQGRFAVWHHDIWSVAQRGNEQGPPGNSLPLCSPSTCCHSLTLWICACLSSTHFSTQTHKPTPDSLRFGRYSVHNALPVIIVNWQYYTNCMWENLKLTEFWMFCLSFQSQDQILSKKHLTDNTTWASTHPLTLVKYNLWNLCTQTLVSNIMISLLHGQNR